MADLALGIIEIFSTCVKAYVILTDALRCPEEQQNLFHRTACQRARLVVWGENWGIDEHTADEEKRNARYSGVELLQAHLRSGPRIGSEILDALNGIAELLVNQNRLIAEYGIVKLAEAREKPELNDFDIIDILHGVSKLAISKTRLDKNRRAINYLGRCDWGIHSPSQYESLLLTLRDFNDDLYNSCTPTARDMMDRALISEMLAGQRDVFTLLHLCNAAADEAEDRSGPSKGFYSSSYKTLSQSAKLRARSNIDPFLKRRLIKPPTVLGREDYVLHTEAAWHGGDACLAVARGQRRVVLVEFKSYVVDGRAFKSLEDIIIKLAESLCAEDKPSEFRLLPCSGYFHDSRGGRYGFVYELPRYLHLRHQDEFRQGGLGIRKPHSLQALLKQLREPIDLGTRFVIARQLVASLYVIHACGFMHKNIRPSSILFLPAESDDRSGGPSKSRRVALGKPYIMGWGFTRPDDIEFVPAAPPPPSGSNQRQDQLVRRDLVVTKDKDLGIYQHPQRLKYPYRPYKHGFDVYSLGLVLLEIGLWQSIESFVEGITDFTTEDFRGYLKERVVPDLRGQCGSIYEQVVQECLATRVDDEEIIEKTLVWDIAGKLWECKA